MFSLKCSPTSYSSIFLDKGKTKTKKKQSKDKVQPFPPSTSPPLVPCIIYIKGSFGVFHILAFYQKITRRELKGEASLFCLIDLFAFFLPFFPFITLVLFINAGNGKMSTIAKKLLNLKTFSRPSDLLCSSLLPFFHSLSFSITHPICKQKNKK